MTRKDFVFLADALKRARPDLPWTGLRRHLYDGWEDAVRGVAVALAEQTKAFDAALFLKNAGVVLPGIPWCDRCRCYHTSTAPHVTTTGERR